MPRSPGAELPCKATCPPGISQHQEVQWTPLYASKPPLPEYGTAGPPARAPTQAARDLESSSLANSQTSHSLPNRIRAVTPRWTTCPQGRLRPSRPCFRLWAGSPGPLSLDNRRDLPDPRWLAHGRHQLKTHACRRFRCCFERRSLLSCTRGCAFVASAAFLSPLSPGASAGGEPISLLSSRAR